MKNQSHMNSGYKPFLMVTLMALISVTGIMAQDTLISSTRIQAAYYKDQDGMERIAAKLLIKAERYEPFANAELQFFAVSDTSNVLLEKITTNDKGEAVYMLKAEDKGYTDSTGLMSFVVEYAGSPTTNDASKDLQVKAAYLKVSFFQEDTSKFISVEAFEKGSDDSPIPIAETEVGLYVKGTFSYFNIAKEVTTPDGKLIVPFPVQMPGDTAGVITIVAKIEDNDVYGNVEAWGEINWARRVPLAVEARRGLGDTDAPLWMVYTLIVLLSAVWLHYAYVIFLIVKIKLAKHEI
jgi:hypothetical protein